LEPDPLLWWPDPTPWWPDPPLLKGLHSLIFTLLGRPASPPLLVHIDRLVLATKRNWEPAATIRLLDEISISPLVSFMLGTAMATVCVLFFMSASPSGRLADPAVARRRGKIDWHALESTAFQVLVLNRAKQISQA
ncbi:hypothetical protein EJB05_11910, partial [Eragrostis curvula]